MEELFNAIKSDNVKMFSKIMETEKGSIGISFGRFPILSLCYLYRSKKIIKVFKKRLEKVANFTETDEPFEIFKKFIGVCGRSARRFQEEDSIVMPAEIFVLLGEDKRQIKVKKIKLISIVALVLAVVITGATLSGTLIPYYARIEAERQAYIESLGKEENPISLSAQSFQDMNGADKYYRLTSDITLPAGVAVADFKGTLIGNDFTITSPSTKPLFTTNNGHIKDVNFVFTATDLKITETGGLIVGTNNKTIENCTSKFNLTLLGGGDADKYFAAFTGTNNGTVKGCSTVFGSSIVSDSVDVSGIAGMNSSGASITNSINHANISQTTNSEAWNPIVAGIVCTNNGTLTKCKNTGDLSSYANAGTSAFVGGIVANSDADAVIDNCASIGKITAESLGDTGEVIAGGIAALNLGFLKNSYSLADISVKVRDDGNFSGELVGIVNSSYRVVDSNVQHFFDNSFENCYFLQKDKNLIAISHFYGVAIDTETNLLVLQIFKFSDLENVSAILPGGITLEKLKNLEIYLE